MPTLFSNFFNDRKPSRSMEDQLIILHEIPGRTPGENVQVLFVHETADVNWTDTHVTIRMDWTRKSDDGIDGIWVRQGSEFIARAHRWRSKRVASVLILNQVLEDLIWSRDEIFLKSERETSVNTANWRGCPDIAGTRPLAIDLADALCKKIDMKFDFLDDKGVITLPKINWKDSIFPRL